MQRVLGVRGLEVQGDRCTLRRALNRGDGVGAVAARLPFGGVAVARLVREQPDLVGHHERGVEADAELTDELLGHGVVFGLAQLLTQLGGTGFGQGADQIDNLGAGHPDAVVANREGAGVLVHFDLNVQIRGVDVEVLVPEGLDPQLVQGIGGVRDQLPQKRILIGVDRMDHQVQQLARLGLKLQLLYAGTHDIPLNDIACESTGAANRRGGHAWQSGYRIAPLSLALAISSQSTPSSSRISSVCCPCSGARPGPGGVSSNCTGAATISYSTP